MPDHPPVRRDDDVVTPVVATSIPIVEGVLDEYAPALGSDFIGYRNHVYRVVNLCLAVTGGSSDDLDKIAVAAAFHDFGSGRPRHSPLGSPGIPWRRFPWSNCEGDRQWRLARSRSSPRTTTSERGERFQAILRWLGVKRCTNLSAFSATSRQPASIVSACPRPGILTISVTPCCASASCTTRSRSPKGLYGPSRLRG